MLDRPALAGGKHKSVPCIFLDILCEGCQLKELKELKDLKDLKELRDLKEPKEYHKL